MSAYEGITRVGDDLLTSWLEAKSRAERARADAERAAAEEAEARQSLGSWMDPGDQRRGERVVMYLRKGRTEYTLQSRVNSDHHYVIEIREKKPKDSKPEAGQAGEAPTTA